MPELYKQIKPEYKLEGYKHPTRQLPFTTRTQRSYAAVLREKVQATNSQDDNQTRYDQPLEQERKRRAIAITTYDFPGLPEEALNKSQEA
eukprot:3090903-Ditylum_brightwellii.AAC.1